MVSLTLTKEKEMPSKQDILIALLPMKKRARKENLLFHHKGVFPEVCLTPGELDSENAVGAYIWGPGYWTLIPNNEKITKEDEMELNIKWVEIREVNVLIGRLYFLADISRAGNVKSFCVAHQTLGGWTASDKANVPFAVTHACLIDEVSHTISSPAHAIGDRVIISEHVEEHMKGDIGEIVGKYDKMGTWCIRMEDNFVILLEHKYFKRYHPEGT